MKELAIFIVLLLLLVSFTIEASCENDANDSMQHFSINYTEARQKFLNASRDAEAVLEHFQNPYATGPQGEILFTDVALLGNYDAETILVLSSGIHGVEGFTGSAIQSYLLKELSGELPPSTGLLLIHSLNPYGFAHLRRFNENNVDLNRNFIDYSIPPDSNRGYDELSDAINPKSISLWADIKSSLKFFSYFWKNDWGALKRVISQGQYNHPKGLFYGGRKDSWSKKTLETIAEKYLMEAKRVVIVDFHTGLGSFGNAEIIMEVKKDSDAYRRAVTWWGEMVRTTVTGESVSVPLTGSLKQAWPRILPNSEVTEVSLEFGTLSALQVFWALRKENWLHHYGGNDHPKAIKIKKNLLRAFYPEDYEWRIKVLVHSKSVVSKVWKQF